MAIRMFPVFKQGNVKGAPTSVPWSVIEPHRAQALANHYQSLERLADRGGLSLREMWAVLNDRAWSNAVEEMLIEDVICDIKALTKGTTYAT
jgi:hypothetical protein